MKKVRFIATGGAIFAAPSAEEYFAALHRSSFEASTLPFSEYVVATQLAVTRWTGTNVMGYTPQQLLDFMLDTGVSKLVEEHSSTCPFLQDGLRSSCECGR